MSFMLLDRLAGLGVDVLAVLLGDGHDGGGDEHDAVIGVDAGDVGDGLAGVLGLLEDLEDGLLEDHDGGALAGLELGDGGGAGLDHDVVGGEPLEIILAVVVILREGGDGGEGGAAGHGVAHGDVALELGVVCKVLEGMGDGHALGGPFVHHVGVIGQDHVAHAHGVPVALLVIGEAEQILGIVDVDGLEIAGLLEFEGQGGLGHQHHVAVEGAGLHLTVDLGDEGAGAAVKEEAAVVAGLEIGEFLFQRLVQHVQHELVHRGIDDDFALHVLVDGEGRRAQGQEHGKRKRKRQDFFHLLKPPFTNFEKIRQKYFTTPPPRCP